MVSYSIHTIIPIFHVKHSIFFPFFFVLNCLWFELVFFLYIFFHARNVFFSDVQDRIQSLDYINTCSDEINYMLKCITSKSNWIENVRSNIYSMKRRKIASQWTQKRKKKKNNDYSLTFAIKCDDVKWKDIKLKSFIHLKRCRGEFIF